MGYEDFLRRQRARSIAYIYIVQKKPQDKETQGIASLQGASVPKAADLFYKLLNINGKAFHWVEHFVKHKDLSISLLSVRACAGAFRGVPVCFSGVLVLFQLCCGSVLVLFGYVNLLKLFQVRQKEKQRFLFTFGELKVDFVHQIVL